MFIKLTRLDNRPVWLNAGFIVTVEPRRDGKGAIVVPIGDGLDYDVRESPDEVLAMLAGAPPPAVVPVPVSDALAPTPADVSPEPVSEPEKAAGADEAGKAGDEAAKPRKRATRTKKATVRKAKAAEPMAEDAAPASVEPQPVAAPLELTEADVARLRKMAPKSVGKLKNTLATQFHVGDVAATVSALIGRGVCSQDGNRILWPPAP